jgi:type I restriction enzyme S subunit
MGAWQTRTIGEVFRVVNGGTPKTGVPEYWGGEHLWITPAEMGGLATPLLSDSLRRLTDEGLRVGAELVPANSIIMSSRAPIGHLVINEVPMAFNQGCKGLVPSADIDTKFAYYFLLANVPLLESLGTGATFKELSGGKLRQVPFHFPSLPEQGCIVAILDEAFECIATAKCIAKRNLRNARDLFVSTAQILLSHGAENWPTKTIDEISTNLDSKRVPITKSDRKPGDFPYYGASGIVDYVADFIFEGDTLLVSEDGANLLARSTPIAFSVSGRYWVNNHAHILKFDHKATQRFVEFYLESIRLDEYITGAAQPKLNQKALNSIPISIPNSVEEQAAVVDKLEQIAEQSGLLEQIYERKLAALDELRTVLLSLAFTGALTDRAVDRRVAQVS